MMKKFVGTSDGKMLMSKAAKGGMSTQSAGPMTASLKLKLQKEAPETLSAPMRKSFKDDDSHQSAVAKFKKFGHWASSK